MIHLHYILTIPFLPLAFAIVDDVPGCACPISLCDAAFEPLVCSPGWGDNAADMLDVFDNSTGICDTFESEEFQDIYGSFDEKPTGVSVLVARMTCDELVQAEDSCHVDLNPLTVLQSWSKTEDSSCGVTSLGNFLSRGLSLRVSPQCRGPMGSFQLLADIVAQPDDDFFDDEISLCDDEYAGKPLFTQEDWVESQLGRRYVCRNLAIIDGTPLSLLAVSIGVDPCPAAVTASPSVAPDESKSPTSAAEPHTNKKVATWVQYSIVLTASILIL